MNYNQNKNIKLRRSQFGNAFLCKMANSLRFLTIFRHKKRERQLPLSFFG